MEHTSEAFRPMRRPKQQLSREECIRLLIAQPRGILSVLGDDGWPYGLPIDHWYCEADGCLYFHCGREGHKLDAIRRCGKVSFCVCDEGRREAGDWALYIRSVIVFGHAQILDDPAQVIPITRQLSQKYTTDTAYIEDEIQKYGRQTLCIRLTPAHICGKLVHEA